MKRILVLGGGYAGVSTAATLQGIKTEVTFVNLHSYHHLTTLLHQPVAGRREYRDLSLSLLYLLPSSVRFLRGRVIGIMPRGNSVETLNRDGKQHLTSDILVIALGWQPQFFDIPGLRHDGLTLDSLYASRLVHGLIGEEGKTLPPTARLQYSRGTGWHMRSSLSLRVKKWNPTGPEWREFCSASGVAMPWA
jgi:NADH dehydrogenase